MHPSAVIAPGVMLQADPGSQLIVAAGVCIGMGCILHAHQGMLEIEAGATLGTGVLVVGHGKIGANACIGAMTTIIDSSVPEQQMISPGSLIGDRSRQADTAEPASEPDVASASSSSSPPSFEQAAESPTSTSQKSASEVEQPPPPPAQEETVRVVYGQSYLERMMITMFPHRKQN